MNLTIRTTKDHYTLELYNPDTTFNRIAGVYAFLIIPTPAVIPTKEESLLIPTFADIKEKYPRHAEPVEAHTSPQSSILHLPSSSNTPYYKSNTSVIPTFEIKRRTESSDTKEESLPIPTFADIKEKYPRHAEPIEAHTHHPSSILWQYSLLYIGITNNFYTRLKQHHKISQAITLGMTHIGILKIASGRKRKNIERELLQTHNPPLNQTWTNDTPRSPP